MALTEQCRITLQSISTATINAVLFKRGLRNTFIRGVHLINPEAPRLVGPAYTLRYIPAREDLDHGDAFENLCHPQRKAVEECPGGAVLVIDAREDASAAAAGSILVTRLMKRGCAGVVTDGGFRDTPAISRLPFPAYHAGPATPASLVGHYAVDINVPIGCGGVPIFPGDILVGDAEGVVVIPRAITPGVVEEAFEQTKFEDFVQRKVEDGETIMGLYPPSAATMEDFERWCAGEQRRGRG
jgi:regulator of RNase E activity RraA